MQAEETPKVNAARSKGRLMPVRRNKWKGLTFETIVWYRQEAGRQNVCSIVGYGDNDSRWNCRGSQNKTQISVWEPNTSLVEMSTFYTMMTSCQIPVFGPSPPLTIHWFILDIHIYVSRNLELKCGTECLGIVENWTTFLTASSPGASSTENPETHKIVIWDF